MDESSKGHAIGFDNVALRWGKMFKRFRRSSQMIEKMTQIVDKILRQFINLFSNARACFSKPTRHLVETSAEEVTLVLTFITLT